MAVKICVHSDFLNHCIIFYERILVHVSLHGFRLKLAVGDIPVIVYTELSVVFMCTFFVLLVTPTSVTRYP